MGLVSALGYSDSQFGLQAARHLVPDGRVPSGSTNREAVHLTSGLRLTSIRRSMPLRKATARGQVLLT